MENQKPKFKVHDVIVYRDDYRVYKRYLQGVNIPKAIVPQCITRIVRVDFEEKNKTYLYTTEYKHFHKDGSETWSVDHIVESQIITKLN